MVGAFPKFRVVDLSHALRPGIPVIPGDPAVVLPFGAGPSPEETLPQTPVGSPTPSRAFTMGEHAGTHVDAPRHFLADGATVDRLPPAQLAGPGVVIDVREAVVDDPGYRLSLDDFLRFEDRHGFIPPRAIVLLCTGWAFRYGDASAYLATDDLGTPLSPGFGAEVVEFLVGQRLAAAIGVDAPSVDVGRSTSYPAHRSALSRGVLCLENLTNLHLLPPGGFLVVVAPLPLAGAAGAPARVLALVP